MSLDHSPIDQRWIQDYCDELLKLAGQLQIGPMRDAVLLRVEHAMDLLEAWQKRNEPRPLPTGCTCGADVGLMVGRSEKSYHNASCPRSK